MDHTFLLDGHEHVVGVKGIALSWFLSYLTDCHQCLDVNGAISMHTTVKFGVPQGYVLGPLGFTLCMQPPALITIHMWY